MSRPAQSVMELYSDLASIDASQRLKAAHTLVSVLTKFQQEFKKQSDFADPPLPESTDAILEQQCAHDVSYGLKRLVRGLPSSREGARQGFALALTELLRLLDFLKISVVVQMLMKYTEITGGMKEQEVREMLFGRIFGCMAIIRAEMLTRETTTTSDVEQVAAILLECTKAKSYLPEAGYSALIELVMQIRNNEEALSTVINMVLSEGVRTVEELWFAVSIQGAKIPFDLPSSSGWKKGTMLLHPVNKKYLVSILKESVTGNSKPHSVWKSILDILLQVPEIVGANTKDSKMPLITFLEFWKDAVDDALFSSSNERKYLGFQIFEYVLPRVSHDQIPFIFSDKLAECFIYNLSHRESHLHKAALHMAKALATFAKEDSSAGLHIVFQLVGRKNGANFDQLTRTKTVESILSNMNAEGVLTYVKHLENYFIERNDAVIEDGDSEAERWSVVAVHRTWAIDSMMLLLRNTKIPRATGNESWNNRIPRFLAMYGMLDMQTAVGDYKSPKPPLSDKIKHYCLDRFLAAAGEIAVAVRPHGETRSEEDTESSLYELTKFVLNIQENHNSKLSIKVSEDGSKARSAAMDAVSKIRSQLSQEPPSRDVVNQLNSLQNLLFFIILTSYRESEDLVDVLQDLVKCHSLLYGKPKGNRKRKAPTEGNEDEEEPRPTDVLVDIIISLLSRPSAHLRTLSERAFRAFCGELTSTGLSLLIQVLQTEPGSTDFENNDEEDDVEMVDGESGKPVEDASEREEENEDGESGDDDDDDDDDEDDEDENEDVDLELRNKIQHALGAAALPIDIDMSDNDEVDNDGDDDGDYDEAFDDDQMEQFDGKLAEIFKEKKRMKTEKEDAKRQILNLKLRILDLLDIWFKKTPSSPLVLEAVLPLSDVLHTVSTRAAGTGALREANQQLYEKLASLIKNRIGGKAAALKSQADVDRAFELLSEIHERASRIKNTTQITGMYAQFANVVVKALVQYESTLPTATSTPTLPTSSKKKKKKDGQAQEVLPSQPAISESVAELYSGSLQTFMTKKGRFQTVFFNDFVSRNTSLGWHLLPSLAIYSTPGQSINAFHLTQSYVILSNLFQHSSKKEFDAHRSRINAHFPRFLKSVEVMISSAASTSSPETPAEDEQKLSNKKLKKKKSEEHEEVVDAMEVDAESTNAGNEVRDWSDVGWARIKEVLRLLAGCSKRIRHWTGKNEADGGELLRWDGIKAGLLENIRPETVRHQVEQLVSKISE
ncbi:DNA polymerase phi-domain-containing protein [Cladochytrium replicatum]|nr:DNA polymerase phi-domain-containing protein [Cladochytrium replicatum]